jgi:hypothetical protein
MVDQSLDIIRAEVEHLSDRDLLLEIIKGQRIQNGTLARHDDDLYGNIARGIRGAKPMAEAHEVAIDRTRVRFQTVIALVLFVGVGNLVALLTLMR